ncbi:MAG: hypothetical protein ACJ73S_32365 [Mycobacteriales bacterium]
MTAQFPDTVRYGGDEYVLTAVDGGPPFDPAAHGLAVAPGSTACWRGHVCTYRLDGDRLLLDRLRVGALAEGASEPPPRLFGVGPRRPGRGTYPPAVYVYARLAAPLDFTGRLLVAADPADAGYVNMGFPPAWLFARVHELRFSGGRLAEAYDRSAALAAVRERLGAGGRGPREGEDSREWISRTFSLSFDYSWPDPDR